MDTRVLRSALLSGRERLQSRVMWLLAAFIGTEVVLFRYGTKSGWSFAGALDDLLLFTVSALILTIARKLLGRWGIFLAVAWMAFLAAATLANQLYHVTFNTWLSLDTLMHVEELDDIQSSIASMMSFGTIVVGVLVPVQLMTMLARAWRIWRPPSRVGLLVVTVLLGLLPGFLRGYGTVTEQNHFLMAAFRHVAQRGALQWGPYAPRVVLQDDPVSELVPAERGYERGGNVDHPLLQVPNTVSGPHRRPNIIVIEAESLRASESGLYGAEVSLTPELDSLAEQGLVAQRFYANGIQTVRSEMATLCGTWPALGSSALYELVPEVDLTCFPELLGHFGWATHWFSGYKAKYANKERFLEAHGFTGIHGIESHGQSDDALPGWGVADTEMASRIVEQLDGAAEPFLAVWITLSNHHPWTWDYPIAFPDHLPEPTEGDTYGAYQRGVYYTDHAIGRFVEAVRERPWGRDAWILIVGDHGMHVFADDDPRSDMQKLEAQFRVPFVFLAPGVVAPGVIERPASQIDIAPTVLELLGIRAPNAFVGQSMLRPADAPASPILLVAESSASLVLDDKRCMVSRVTCYEDAQPQCVDDEDPAPTGHTCFETEGDLLAPRLPPVERLEPAQAATMRQRLQRLPRLQTYLEGHDRLGAGETWPANVGDSGLAAASQSQQKQ